MSARARVFAGYRRLFRARKNLFKRDEEALRESRVAIKAEFLKNKAVATEGTHFEGLLTMIDEAEEMLRHGIVQGSLNDNTGHYGKRHHRLHYYEFEYCTANIINISDRLSHCFIFLFSHAMQR